jgi:hypothetical protein
MVKMASVSENYSNVGYVWLLLSVVKILSQADCVKMTVEEKPAT